MLTVHKFTFLIRKSQGQGPGCGSFCSAVPICWRVLCYVHETVVSSAVSTEYHNIDVYDPVSTPRVGVLIPFNAIYNTL